MALFSNIGLITVEALTDEANEKEPTFRKYLSPDNDEFKTILIDDLCVFDKKMVYRRGILEKRIRYTWIPACRLSF